MALQCLTHHFQPQNHHPTLPQHPQVTIVYTGLMVGNIASGPVGVRFGRREAVLTSYFCTLVMGDGSSYL